MISQEAIQAILGIKEKVHIRAEEMADKLNITFFPHTEEKISKNLFNFKKILLKEFKELKVNVVPYEEAIVKIRFSQIIKRFVRIIINNLKHYLGYENHLIPRAAIINLLRRKKIKPGISVIAMGENETWNLPIDHTTSFTKSSVITILDFPENLNEDTDFFEHFDTAMQLFAYHMTNIVIGVKEDRWILYNFNASHPTYGFKNDFRNGILHGLIPKIVAPIKPHIFSDFFHIDKPFDAQDSEHLRFTNDLIESGKIFAQTNLFPKGKKIDELPFRNKFYLWVGKIHLDERNGMSYGFLARQLPTKPSPLMTIDRAERELGLVFKQNQDWSFKDKKLYILIEVNKIKLVMKVPDVWVLSQRSGCDKTNIQPGKDLIKLGLCDGRMYIQTPLGLKLTKDYKPSFDTTVILAHAVGNAIIASIEEYLKPNNELSETILKHGYAISHWHGYFNSQKIPEGFYVHGLSNPNVSCSSPQSAIYALGGKLDVYNKCLADGKNYLGDIHVEPHHGTNICYPTLIDLGKLILSNPELTSLGNKYL